MTPQEFVAKWKRSELRERAGAQEHFIDLCRMIGERTPAEADPKGEWFTFEKGTPRTGGHTGWADVCRQRSFAWEYKGKHKNLDAAYEQLLKYAPGLNFPPLLIVSDMETIRIHTAFTNQIRGTYEIQLDELIGPESPKQLRLLRDAFNHPEALKPHKTRVAVTSEAADEFGAIARRLRDRGHDPQRVAHFVIRLLFCMFAEDIDALPGKLFENMLTNAEREPEQFEAMARELFGKMRTGGFYGRDKIDRFNGGLFDSDDALPLDKVDLAQLLDLARKEWDEIEPAIFGTLFERGLDPDKRSQLGAHYTDVGKIRKIINPVILDPLDQEWIAAKLRIVEAIDQAKSVRGRKSKDKWRNIAESAYLQFLHRLNHYQVFDPACGSGNFLYLALQGLKDLEHKVIVEAEQMGLGRGFPTVDPSVVRGYDISPYAAELARATIWIGHIQWMRQHGFELSKNPILKPLDQIECRDALMNPDGSEAEWPKADAIVGNPPFLGDKMMRSVMGEPYVTPLRALYEGRVPGGADLVTYWFEKARAQIEKGMCARSGLVATNSIRGGANRKVLDHLLGSAAIFCAWSDQEWAVEGAAVRVSLICFAPRESLTGTPVRLDGKNVQSVLADLTGHSGDAPAVDLTKAFRLKMNSGKSFMGITKTGPFDVPGDIARSWLRLPNNPNGESNKVVLRPAPNGKDITDRFSDTWLIDFEESEEQEAALFEAPFQYAVENVKGYRLKHRQPANREYWWRFERGRPAMRRALTGLDRFIGTSMVSKHRFFVWLHTSCLAQNLVIVIARDDDTTFGILHSRFHEAWALRKGTHMGVGNDPRYTPTTTFETFPFPEGLTPDVPAADYADDPRAVAIAEAARELDRQRNAWLNPEEWVRRVPEVVPGYPDRILPRDEEKAKLLKERTLTKLYNARPQWLANAHAALDAAVAAAYGWPADLAEDEVLARLLALNLERAAKQ